MVKITVFPVRGAITSRLDLSSLLMHITSGTDNGAGSSGQDSDVDDSGETD
jgi:hypothetical protein